MAAEFVLEMNGIGKAYGQNTVLDDVTLHVKPGEIHALLGENGAGKSTLMNILFGMPVIFETGGFKGEIKLGGEATHIASPMQAMEQGIGMVHQEFMLIPGFTVTENIKLNRETTRSTIFSRLLGSDLERLETSEMRLDARKALDSVGIGIEEFSLVKGLPIGYMQFVEIAREIDKSNMRLMVFDEPTAVLTESEATQLLKVMKDIAARGIAIIFITHRLDEVMEAADSITVLRDGKLAAVRSKADTSLEELAALMIGRGSDTMIKSASKAEASSDQIVMKIRDLHVAMPGEMVRGIDLDVRQGEIIGLGGLAGQGKVGLPNGIMGIYHAEGDVEFMGEKLPLNNAREALKRGLAMVSEDRRGVGLLLDQSIEDNIVFNAIEINNDFCVGPSFMRIKSSSAIRKYADEMIKE
ncbi:MAG: ATP-binding cassette domain-containing protein, partial [Eubacteriales bacterium]|nr:ATP-binding cassette domain-containing protein [Eubacteriales bacterium]